VRRIVRRPHRCFSSGFDSRVFPARPYLGGRLWAGSRWSCRDRVVRSDARGACGGTACLRVHVFVALRFASGRGQPRVGRRSDRN